MTASPAPAMPGEIERIISDAKNALLTAPEAARAIMALFAPVLTEKERVARREERIRVCNTATAMCEKWIATFAGQEIKHTAAHEYPEDAIRDIIDQIEAIRAQGE